jgi:phospholipid/cholesterol/gamma-HCH transport system permease protein
VSRGKVGAHKGDASLSQQSVCDPPHEPLPDTRDSQTGRPRAVVAKSLRDYVRAHPVAAIETTGNQVVLGMRCLKYLVIDLFTGRFPWKEFVRQGAFMSGSAVLPTLLVAIPIGVTLSIQFALLAGQVGATSLAGAASGLAIVRQGASLVAAIMMASAVGSAITADLGSRTMREEVDAMEVMGVSAIRRLVVPRAAAAMLVAVGLTGTTCFVGFFASYLFNVYFQHGAPGSFVSTFAAFATVGDLWLALFKAVLFGLIVAIVSCDKGLRTKGGPAGVANSVNAAVVESILVLMLLNVMISQVYVLMVPQHGL